MKSFGLRHKSESLPRIPAESAHHRFGPRSPYQQRKRSELESLAPRSIKDVAHLLTRQFVFLSFEFRFSSFIH